MKKFVPFFAAAIAAVVLAGCGGDDTSIVGKSPRVRALNAIYGVDNIRVQFEESPEDNQLVSFGELTDYAIVDNVQQSVRFRNTQTGQIEASVANTLFRNDRYYTVVGTGGVEGDSRSAFAIEDKVRDPSNGTVDIRYVNAGFNGSTRVYIVPAGETIEGTTPIFSGIRYAEATDRDKYHNVTAGSYRIVVQDGSSGRTLSDETLTFEQNQTFTIFAVPVTTGAGTETVRIISYAEGENIPAE